MNTQERYERADELLDEVEKPLEEIADEIPGKDVSIERWRWDEPLIRLTWVDPDDSISRNILVHLRDVDAEEFYLEANAWDDSTEDGVITRQWENLKSGDGLSTDKVHSEIRTLFESVDNLSIEDLSNTDEHEMNILIE